VTLSRCSGRKRAPVFRHVWNPAGATGTSRSVDAWSVSFETHLPISLSKRRPEAAFDKLKPLKDLVAVD
jgi:hypothetical protein